MPDLLYSLQSRDLGYLRIIADLWRVEINAPDAQKAISYLTPLLLDRELVEDVVASLPDEAQLALQALVSNGNRMSWAVFTRRFGEVRELGEARRERERPYESENATPTEALWYRGFVGKTFFDMPNGPLEFAYIPDDLSKLIPIMESHPSVQLGRPAYPSERVQIIPANDSVLDDACTLLVGLRMGLPAGDISSVMQCGARTPYPLSYTSLQSLLVNAGLLDQQREPIPTPTRSFLEMDRGEALSTLTRTWIGSATFNELRLIPGLKADGEWQNNPYRTRNTVLGFLSTLRDWGLDYFENSLQDNWKNAGKEGFSVDKDTSSILPFWSLGSFLAAIKDKYPDFQRPEGDYDSWYIRREDSDDYLRGFANWDAIDGELIRFMIIGPLHWLGMIDLAGTEKTTGEEHALITAFRFSNWAGDLLSKGIPSGLRKREAETLTIRRDGRIRIPIYAPRTGRYQIARFCVWDGFSDGFFRYRLTPASLRRAGEAGLSVKQLIYLLKHYGAAFPPSLAEALERWEARGSEARLERVMVLRVKDPEVINRLRNSRAVRFLGDPLGPRVVIVKPGSEKVLLGELAEMGYLGDLDFEE